MVKNTQGGSKHKSQARKAQFVKHVDVEPSGPHEKYAKVTKMYGNGMCQVETQDDKVSLLCHIRGKFRGKNKKHNSIVVNSIVIIGLREWESTLKNCDLISVISSPSNMEICGENQDDDDFVFGEETFVEPQNIPDMDKIEMDLDVDIDDI